MPLIFPWGRPNRDILHQREIKDTPGTPLPISLLWLECLQKEMVIAAKEAMTAELLDAVLAAEAKNRKGAALAEHRLTPAALSKHNMTLDVAAQKGRPHTHRPVAPAVTAGYLIIPVIGVLIIALEGLARRS